MSAPGHRRAAGKDAGYRRSRIDSGRFANDHFVDPASLRRERRRLGLKDDIESALKAEGFAAFDVLGAKLTEAAYLVRNRSED
jgi:hypothetical protein